VLVEMDSSRKGAPVNSPANDFCPWDGTALYFGSTRPGGEGMADHYVTTREPIHN
jgi:hypothetical protein